MNLPKNVGKNDRNLRLVAAGLLVLAGVFVGPWWLTLLGLVALGTAVTGTCLAYVPLKIDTTKGDQA